MTEMSQTPPVREEIQSTTVFKDGLERIDIGREVRLPQRWYPALDLVEAPNLAPAVFDSRDILMVPEKPKPNTVITITPGFGHTSENLGKPFETLAEELARSTSIVTMISVDKPTPENGGLINQIPLEGKFDATMHGLLGLSKNKRFGPPENVISVGFSTYCLDVVYGAYMLAYDRIHGFENLKKVGGLILVAPTDNPWNILQVMKDAGRPVSTDSKGEVIIGRRGTKVSRAFTHANPEFLAGGDFKLVELAKALKDKNIPIRVLWGEGDTVVNRNKSKYFATMCDVPLETVIPSIARDSAIHDFDDPQMRGVIVNAVQQFIQSPVERKTI